MLLDNFIIKYQVIHAIFFICIYIYNYELLVIQENPMKNIDYIIN